MNQETVETFALQAGTSTERMLKSLSEAGLPHVGSTDVVTDQHKAQLLSHLRKASGSTETRRKIRKPFDLDREMQTIPRGVSSAASLSAATDWMIGLARSRSEPRGSDLSPDKVVRYPVGFFFVRGDRAGSGQQLADECMASYEYWDLDSSNFIDVIFPGWKREGSESHFDTKLFLAFRAEIENSSRWQFRGEHEILLLNFDYHGTGIGSFNFDECISLPVESMIQKGIVASIDSLMHELVSVAKKAETTTVGEIGANMAGQRARRSLWNYLKERFSGGTGRIYDELRPFVVCNLSKKDPPSGNNDLPTFLRRIAD